MMMMMMTMMMMMVIIIIMTMLRCPPAAARCSAVWPVCKYNHDVYHQYDDRVMVMMMVMM